MKQGKRVKQGSVRLLLMLMVLSAASSGSQIIVVAQDSDRVPGAEVVTFYGYDDCIQLSNDSTVVILCPAAGGRVLKYALHDQNVLYLPAGDEGWTWNGTQQWANMHAGRFDIGPEQMVPKRNLLWQGQWKGEITGARSARLTSQVDDGPGVYLVRDFELSPNSSRLSCKQTIVHATDKPVEYCHWSRTFVRGHGICIVPLTTPGRFPAGYVRYDPPGKLLNMQPEDAHVIRRGDYLLVTDRPQYPKLGFDSMQGWLAYHAPGDLLFVKRFATYPERAYNEVAGLTISIWYPDNDMVELEPIGPRERLVNPGDRAAFTEIWDLLEYPTPDLDSVDPDAISVLVDKLP